MQSNRMDINIRSLFGPGLIGLALLPTVLLFATGAANTMAKQDRQRHTQDTTKVKTDLSDDNRKLRTIFNNDIDNILSSLDSKKSTEAIIEDYRRAVNEIVNAKPGILAQNVGLPDPVNYRSKVATTWDKYHTQVVSAVWGKAAGEKDSSTLCMKALLDAGTDPLAITIEECRKGEVAIVASYRMNSEDFSRGQLDLYDFGRQNKHLRISGANCLDPAQPKVYKHRMAIFREAAENYDIDGIEFDFRRTFRMISAPRKNHAILTKMVAQTRQMLDEVAKRKGRKRLLLGVRVSATLDTTPSKEAFPGMVTKANDSCLNQGTDVKTWIEKGYVDYVCPTLFWPRWPGHPRTREFVELAKGHNVGIYPTLFPLPGWLEDKNSPDKGPIEPGDTRKIQRYKDGFCEIALKMYEDGADGISTFNWYFHLHLAKMPNQWQAYYGYGMGGSPIQKYVLSILGDPEALRRYQKASWTLPPK